MTLGETLREHVFLYCERGTSVALWAEPFNAISNAGFLLAALIFWQLLLWRPPQARSADHYLLMALVFLIGLGSLAFHLFATRGTELADVIPISLFMLIYFGFALNRFLDVPPGWTVLLVIVFAGVIGLSTQINCLDGVIAFGVDAPDAKPCLNGSVGYLPALGALIVIGMVLAERRHRAAPYVLAAAVIFVASIILRSADLSLCDKVVIEGRDVGTHFIWHLLNAVVLFLLLCASLKTGTKADAAQDGSPAPIPAETEQAASDTVEKTGAAQDGAEDDNKEDKPSASEGEVDDAEPEAEEEPKAKDEPEEEEAEEEIRKEESKTDETEGDPLKAMTTLSASSKTSEPEDATPAQKDSQPGGGSQPEEGSPQEESSQEEAPQEEASALEEGAEPDKVTTPEDVFKAVKALSTEDTPEAAPRKRGSRRKKPSSSD